MRYVSLLIIFFDCERLRSQISQIQSISVLNVATVDVPGVIISTPMQFHASHRCTLLGMVYLCVFCMVSVFHIGVGSNVVCSTEIGNARALVRGMDNRRFHAFLCPDIFDNALVPIRTLAQTMMLWIEYSIEYVSYPTIL